jgi:hypothetical protein
MQDVHTLARRDLSRILLAALLLDPLGSGLTEDEIRAAALQSGMSIAVLDEIIQKFWDDHAKNHADRTIVASSMDLALLLMSGQGASYPSMFPMAMLPRLGEAFTQLERKHGMQSAKSIELLLTECREPPDMVRRAIGFLMTFGHIERVADGFRRRLTFEWSMGTADPNHPETRPLRAAMSVLEPILVVRTSGTAPAVKPIERFHHLLVKQGWRGLAEWWAATAREAAGLWEYYPTAATVIAGAMLETALVAIAEPSRRAGEWNQKFLEDPPQKWQLKQLIQQAEAARTFSSDDAAHARTLAEVRNRIHAGRFAEGGPDPFRPPSTNAHEAQIAKLHLDLLLTRILEWKPVASLL